MNNTCDIVWLIRTYNGQMVGRCRGCHKPWISRPYYKEITPLTQEDWLDYVSVANANTVVLMTRKLLGHYQGKTIDPVTRWMDASKAITEPE